MDAYKLAFQHVMNQPLPDEAEELHRNLIAGSNPEKMKKMSEIAERISVEPFDEIEDRTK